MPRRAQLQLKAFGLTSASKLNSRERADCVSKANCHELPVQDGLDYGCNRSDCWCSRALRRCGVLYGQSADQADSVLHTCLLVICSDPQSLRLLLSHEHAHNSLSPTGFPPVARTKCCLAGELCIGALRHTAIGKMHDLLCRVVAVIRTYMTYVWGFGVAKPVAGLQPLTVGADEDKEGVRPSSVH